MQRIKNISRIMAIFCIVLTFLFVCPACQQENTTQENTFEKKQALLGTWQSQHGINIRYFTFYADDTYYSVIDDFLLGNVEYYGTYVIGTEKIILTESDGSKTEIKYTYNAQEVGTIRIWYLDEEYQKIK